MNKLQRRRIVKSKYTQYVAGIDPGISGAYAIVSISKGVMFRGDAFDLPTVVAVKNRRRVDAYGLCTMIDTQVGPCKCYIEKVSAMPLQGVSSAFGFGHSAGMLEGIIAAMKIPVELVTPQKWMKGVCGSLPRDRKLRLDAIRGLASKRFPNVELHKKKDHNKACALLIAMYGAKDMGLIP